MRRTRAEQTTADYRRPPQTAKNALDMPASVCGRKNQTNFPRSPPGRRRESSGRRSLQRRERHVVLQEDLPRGQLGRPRIAPLELGGAHHHVRQGLPLGAKDEAEGAVPDGKLHLGRIDELLLSLAVALTHAQGGARHKAPVDLEAGLFGVVDGGLPDLDAVAPAIQRLALMVEVDRTNLMLLDIICELVSSPSVLQLWPWMLPRCGCGGEPAMSRQ
mmetsp:Transcript_27163/g.72427  ORF Transcript_27163/g.72427 Transcript_27163/m.72427 type:complete len:217 (-) Transcript_27163:5-655(-)